MESNDCLSDMEASICLSLALPVTHLCESKFCGMKFYDFTNYTDTSSAAFSHDPVYLFIYLFTFYCLFMCYAFLPLFFHGATIKLKLLQSQLHRAAFFSYSGGKNLRFLLNFINYAHV